MPAAITQGDPLVPLPMRVTRRQHERLKQARGRDSYPVQEHVRRALDLYLDLIERSWPEIPPPALPPSVDRDVKPSPPGVHASAAAPSAGKPAPVVASKQAKRVPSRKSPKVVYR
jgi:hypothetical protein